MTDMVIPPEAAEAGARSIDPAAFDETDPLHAGPTREYRRQVARERSTAAIGGALPHLRPLFETATKVALELGRKEAAEEIAAAIEALDGPMTGENTTSDYLVLAARIAREIGTRETGT